MAVGGLWQDNLMLMPTGILLLIAMAWLSDTCSDKRLCGQVPKKQGMSGKKKLAKVLTSILSDIKRTVLAKKENKGMWEVFLVSCFALLGMLFS